MEQDALNSLSSTPDLDLARRHRYGDASAFEEVYREYAQMVFNLCLRMVGNREEAEDLAQDVFLRIHRHLGRFSGRSALKTWIYRVTINYCRSKLSRKRWFTRTLKEEDEEGGVQLEDPARSPESETLAHDDARTVMKALLQVKPKFREAVVLRDLEGMSYDEIAEVLKVRIGTVRSRIARGRDQLRKALESSGRATALGIDAS